VQCYEMSYGTDAPAASATFTFLGFTHIWGPAKKRAKLAGQFSLLNRGARGPYDAFVFCDGMLVERR